MIRRRYPSLPPEHTEPCRGCKAGKHTATGRNQLWARQNALRMVWDCQRAAGIQDTDPDEAVE